MIRTDNFCQNDVLKSAELQIFISNEVVISTIGNT